MLEISNRYSDYRLRLLVLFDATPSSQLKTSVFLRTTFRASNFKISEIIIKLLNQKLARRNHIDIKHIF